MEPKTDNEKCYTITEAAELLGRHRNTISNWCTRGHLEFNQVGNGWRYIPESEIVRILKPTLGMIEESRREYENGDYMNVRDVCNELHTE